MNRFIRTKNETIIDLEMWCHSIRHQIIRKIKNGDIQVEKQADTIEGLIEVGDLVRQRNIKENYLTNVFEMDTQAEIDSVLEDKYFEIAELYTKQGRNYVLVWTKEEGVI